MDIRKATPADADEIWGIISEVIAAGDTYVFAPNSSNHFLTWSGLALADCRKGV